MCARITRWFEAGAAALRGTLNAHGFAAEIAELDRRFPDGAYACPCCLNAYGRSGLSDQPRILTEDHVPPKLAGGVELLLTCAPCNNESGRVWDGAASRSQELHDAVLGHTQGPSPVTLTIDGISLRGTLNPTAPATHGLNDPKMLQAAETRLDQVLGSASEVQFQIGHHQPIDAAAATWGWIRAAYLAAFAVHGYRYALMSVLTPIRAQLASPQPVDAWGIVVPTEEASGARRIYLVREPEHLRGLMVDFGHVRVFLPAWQFPRDVHAIEDGVTRLRNSPNVPMLVRPIPWPTEPLYLLDPQSPAADGPDDHPPSGSAW